MIFQFDKKLIAYNKWQPQWFVFPFSKEIRTFYSSRSKDTFLINNKEVHLSKFKKLLFFKKTKKTIHGRVVRHFLMRASFEETEKDKWTIRDEGNSIIITFNWQSENIRYDFELSMRP